MLRLRSAFTFVLAVVVLAASATAASAQEALDREVACNNFVPAHLATVPTSERIVVRLAVVLHDVEIETARAIVARAEQAYAPLDIELEPTFLLAHVPETEAEAAFARLSELFGGKRPDWAHAVILVSNEDMAPDSANAAAGQARCTGGIQSPEKAFAFAEANHPGEEVPAEIVAHELAHLLGAHHHYGVCGGGAAAGASVENACSLMFPEGQVISLRMEALEAAVVRGYAEAYVKPIAATPPPDGTALTAIPPEEPPVDPCAEAAFVDPPGDAATFSDMEADEADVLEGRFFFRDGRPWFRITVKEADGRFANADGVSWSLRFTADGVEKSVVAEWNGSGAPTASLTDDASGARTAIAGAQIVTGAPGIVEIPWPLPVAAALTFTELQGTIGPRYAQPTPIGFNRDSAAPGVAGGRLSDCAAAQTTSTPTTADGHGHGHGRGRG